MPSGIFVDYRIVFNIAITVPPLRIILTVNDIISSAEASNLRIIMPCVVKIISGLAIQLL
jgi:hypothetical protein